MVNGVFMTVQYPMMRFAARLIIISNYRIHKSKPNVTMSKCHCNVEFLIWLYEPEDFIQFL